MPCEDYHVAMSISMNYLPIYFPITQIQQKVHIYLYSFPCAIKNEAHSI